MSNARVALVTYMSELSERCYCAGWLDGTEKELRRWLRPGRGKVWGLCRAKMSWRFRLWWLSARAGFWWPASYEEAWPYLEPNEAWPYLSPAEGSDDE